MKNITLILVVLIAFCWKSNAQYTEDFDTDTNLPVGWNVINQGGMGESGVDGWTIFNSGTFANSGTNTARIQYDAVAHDDYLIAPAITVAAGVNDRVSFFIRSQNATFLESYEVRLSTASNAVDTDFNLILQAEETAAPTAFEKKEFSLAAYVGQTVYVAIRATGTDRDRLYVDDFVNDAVPSCSPPTNGSINEITDTTMGFTWTDEPNSSLGYTLELGVSGFAPGTGTEFISSSPPQGIGADGLSFVSLTPSTTYDIYMRSNCDTDGFSVWTGPFTATTLGGPGEDCSLPLAATVETDCSAATPITIDFTTAPNIGVSGTCDTAGVNIGFWYEFTAPTSGGVSISNSGNNNEYVILDGCGGTELVCSAMPATSQIIGLTPTAVYKLAIWKDSFQTLTTDTFCIEALSCLPLTDLSVTPTATTEADLSWTENNAPASSNWEYIIQAPGTGAPTGAGIGTMSNPVSVSTGLVYGTSYEFYVRADCAGAFSDWAGPFEWLQVLPPANNDCSGAVALSVGAVYADNPVDGTIFAATESGISNSCGGVAAFEVWYSVVVPAAGDITIETGPDAATGDTTFDSAIEVYSSSDNTCSGTLTSIECDDDDADTGFYSSVSLEGLPAGDTLFIRVWEYGNDQSQPFSISAYSATLDVDTLEYESAFTYFPNPVKNTLTLNAQNTIEDVTMFNMLGQVVLKANPKEIASNLDMSSLQTGTYFVQVTIAKVTKTVRIIKQ